MDIAILKSTAQKMMAFPKGLLAADESSKTIQKRFDANGIECTEETRLAYRTMLFATVGVEEFLSGIILFDETIRQEINGVSVPKYLESKGILAGIKVDKGTHDLVNFPGEKVAEGLDGLRDRLKEYFEIGARFAKFRSTIAIGDGGIPTDLCIEANAETLARYAALCQEANIVPIVEPEVLLDGDHTIEQCFDAQVKTLKKVFERLQAHKVVLEGIILKPSMVLSGKDCPTQADSKKVAAMSVDALKASVPENVGGIAFLSGGQSSEFATENLAEINKIGGPWILTFSFSRGLQNDPMKIWSGKAENVKSAQDEFYKRCKAASLARQSITL